MTTVNEEKAEVQQYPNPNTVPMHLLERVFWRRKLPRSMLFYLKCISRELMLNGESENYLKQAADFFQNLLKYRKGELKMLPMDSYLDKLIRKLGLHRTPASPEPPSPLLNPVRCSRCGRWLNPRAQRPEGAAPSADNVITHMEGDEECVVIALPSHHANDAFGRLISHVVGADSKEDRIVTRSLSFLVDY